MDKNVVIEKMQDVVLSMRKQLADNEDSSLSNFGNSFKMGFQSLKASMSGDEVDKQMLASFKADMDRAEDSLKHNNRAGAAQAIDSMERSIQNYRSRSIM